MVYMELNTILEKNSIDPAEVLVLRHTPKEPGLHKVFSLLATQRPELYNAYQQTQIPAVEKCMVKAKYVASLIGHKAGQALFVGLFRCDKTKDIRMTAWRRLPLVRQLRDLGMKTYTDKRHSLLWFELVLTEICAEWKGKLVVTWPKPERSWFRWADRKTFPVHSILEDSALVKDIPPWNQLVLTWQELRVLPRQWENTLREWRAIYFIFDTSNHKGYVGSTPGKENLLGRWRNYAKSGHGDNKKLKERNHAHFQFSILELVSPTMPPDDLVRLEETWKDRLHTRGTHGLNC